MAAPPGASDVAQHWDAVLKQLKDLSEATVQQNSELTARVADLEEELAVWKQARALILERQRREHDAEVAALRRRIAALESAQDQESIILCVIDGDRNVFHPALLAAGHDGGRQAAKRLTQGIAAHLARAGVQPRGRLSFWLSLYADRRGLPHALAGAGVCGPAQLDAFLRGFAQASPRFLLVDAGDAGDAKIREYVQTYIRFPQTLRIFLGGGHSSAYLPTLTALAEEALLDKLIILKGSTAVAAEIDAFHLPSLDIEDLFCTHPPPAASSSLLGPLQIPSLAVGFLGFAGNSPVPSNISSQGTGRSIDPTLPLHKQAPPPCNEHYLMSCAKGDACKYSHDYMLTPDQLLTLANNAKKAPCNFLKNGQQCPFGDKCCWGHVCPKGPGCFHLSKGKCWFKGQNMHGEMELLPV